jgi:hypothetical protein
MEQTRKIMKRAVGRMVQIIDLLHFGDDENWLGSLVGGQPDDLDFGLSEDIWKLWMLEGGIWVAREFNWGFVKMKKKNTDMMIFG